MYDAGKIVPGLILFLGLVTFPMWYGVASGAPAGRPDLVVGTEEKRCVESTEFMRASHMVLLESWRDQGVREGETEYVSADGKRHEISLTGNCLSCHTNKAEFCDRCHEYTQVKPVCWDCHLAPKEKKT